MKKLTLDALTVESFHVDAKPPARRGTVHGNAPDNTIMIYDPTDPLGCASNGTGCGLGSDGCVNTGAPGCESQVVTDCCTPYC